MNKPVPLTRRQFVRRTSMGAACAAAPGILPSRLWGETAPSKQLTVGLIGCGNIATGHLDTLLGFSDSVRILAVCDVDRERREAAAQRINREYGATVCRAHTDFRELNRRTDLDAVYICTPDHWHALQGIDAMRQGKDIYIEKPLTLTIAEGRALVACARRHRRVVQHGTWQRSMGRFHDLVAFIRADGLGKLERIECPIGPNNRHVAATWEPQPVPEGLDWEMWLGPAPWRPYHPLGCHYNFRFIAENASGQITNLGAHCLDIGQWALGTDASGPVEAEGHGQYPTSGLFTTATRIDVTFRYANGTSMRCFTTHEGSGNNSARFYGKRGWVDIGYAKMSASDPGLLREMQAAGRAAGPAPSTNHYENFFQAVRTRGSTVADAETAHRTTTICNLGTIAMTLGRKLRWDPVREEFIGDDMANRMRRRAMRAPWGIGA